METPIYVIAGFLDAGKTTFINNILSDGFAREDKTLLIRCEEGEVEYAREFLKNVVVVTVEDEEELTKDFLYECKRKFKPEQVLVEYNGMWPMEKLRDLPADWILYQVMTLADATTFELYVKNMGQLMMEKIANADMIAFNRCTDELKEALRQRNFRMVNNRADIFLEDVDGNTEDYITDDTPPFDLDQDIIDIPDDDFGVFYVDVMDHPDRYVDKVCRVKLVMGHSKQWPGTCCPGRFAMVCCEEDIAFLGLIAVGEGLDKFENYDWAEATVKMGIAEHPAYQGPGPVMFVQSIAPCDPAVPDIVSF